MNFAELQNEVIMSRFDEHRRDSVKMWINLRYSQVNAMTDWPWKYPSTAEVSWGSSTEEATLPMGVKVLDVLDSTNDTRLLFMPYDEFAQAFLTDESASSATTWTIRADGPDRLLLIRPLPGAVTLTLTISETPAMLEADADEPVWPEDFHYALVLGALSTGLKVENDPTWEPLELEFNTMVAAMKDVTLPANIPDNRQYGRDMLGYEWEMSWP